MTFNIVIVKWIDSTYYRLEHIESEEELNHAKPRILYTVGHLIKEDENFITLCEDYEPITTTPRLIMSIPKQSIFWYQIKKIKIKETDHKK